jgi:hypothetical protein
MTGLASQPGNAHKPGNARRPSGLLRAPADRPAGRRGPRAPLAGLVALATLFPLSVAQFEPADPAWTRPAFALAAAAGLVSTLLLWVARRRYFLVLAVGLALLGLVGTVAAERARTRVISEEEKWGGFVMSFYDEHRGARLSTAEAEAVPKGLTREQLRARLGAPAGSAIQRVHDGPDLPCLAYRSAGTGPRRLDLHGFCFSDGRYEALREW